MNRPQTYAAAGVDYGTLDPFKLLAQKLAVETLGGPDWLRVIPQEHRRGDSAYIIEVPPLGYIAHVEEGLGTLILVADTYYRLTGGASGYNSASQGTVAMIVNDMATLGVPPISLQMHLGVGDGKWLTDIPRIEGLLHGWKSACHTSGAIWTGGETPSLPGIINSASAVLAGSAVGFLPSPGRPFDEEIREGDRIIGVASSGVHANGISLVRKIGDALPENEMLDLYRMTLVPTRIYTPLINEMVRRGIRPSYVSHISGHGLRKVMRAKNPFTYRLHSMLTPHPIFGKIQELGNVESREMWGNYNMGTGYVLIVRPDNVESTLITAKDTGFTAREIGCVEAGQKQVIIEPADITFEEESMVLR